MSDAPASNNLLDAGLAFAMRVASAGLVFGLQVLLARLMPNSDYGGFVTLWTWMIAFGSFSAFGLAEAGVRFLPRYLVRGRSSAVGGFIRTGFAISTGGAVLLGALGVLVSRFIDGEAALIVLFIALGLPFLAIEFYLEGVARGFGWYRLTTLPVYIVRPILIGATVAALAALGFEITLALVGTVVVVAMACVSAAMALIMRIKLADFHRAAAVSRPQARLWIMAALPLLLVSGLEDLVTYCDVLLISLLLPAEQVGIYFAAARVLALANFVYFAMYLVAGRRFALDLAARDKARLESSLLQSSRLTFWLTVVAVAGTAAIGPVLLGAFGQAFVAGYPAMLILGAGMLARALAGQASELLLVGGHQRQAALTLAATLCCNVVLTVLLVPFFGIVGAALGTAIAMVVRTVLIARVVHKVSGVRIVSLRLPTFSTAI
ncbi:polysaccharide export related protein [Devosia pacifica]|uniref:Polysaccharide export related protein n=1 Tax=Devosia pacifica TaxID=1335967 RepID=A0A918VPY6_9HYPH|nr:polysaccharide biosynthesis C-terminal domain-containing protein [Devosia pacifica]GHA14464.1 polysaccharide export related protein [Devosia pacifica]